MNKPTEIRNYILGRLEADLIGPMNPEDPEEVLRDYPTDKYLTGILYPRQTLVPQSDDDELAAGEDEEGSGEEGEVPLSQCIRPASAGLSFRVKATNASPPSIRIIVTAARYLKRWVSPDNPDELTDVERKGKDNIRWLRIPPPQVDVPITLEKIGESEQSLGDYGLPGLKLYLQVAHTDEGTAVTLVIINDYTDAHDRETNESHTFFQTGLNVLTSRGTEFVGRAIRREATTPDDQTAALIYRDFLEFATGHTCSAQWDAVDGAIQQVRTAWLPASVVDAVSAQGDKVFESVRNHPTLHPFSADWLAEAKKADLIAGLALLVDAYSSWIVANESRINSLDETLRSFANAHAKCWRSARDRMQLAIKFLDENSAARRAFQLANAAMTLQRKWSRNDKLNWRPFQLGFQLLVLESALIATHEDRSTMDLLWFPTGGGKTEAYLAVIALILFYRRLSRDNSDADSGGGVNVIMRYTLRVLTTQQFERAAYLICACERLRIDEKLPGTQRFSIGLWVGSSAIANTVVEAHGDSQRRAMQIKQCPCCGAKLKLDSDHSRYAVICAEAKCFFGSRNEPLPIWTVDEDIYRELPSLLIGTIDKFAQIARRNETRMLFGITTSYAPPDLIIQDELHLISGPLGTMAGLYEIAVDEFCSSSGAIPKVIGSTATIKMANEQVLALFNRSVFQFPPPGLDSTNSCFAVRDEGRPGRLYVGVTTAGRSAKFTLQAVAASLLQSASSNGISASLKDAYWTLVAYFNSLRELGGAHVLMLDDVPKSVSEYAARRGETARKINEPAELTSRLSQAEIPDVLRRLAQNQNTGLAEDALLSTNMISVGVDVPRLALMVVNGQPKAISEYIQATSRVGRDVVPGLVVTIFNNAKPRDRSRYENFATWHATLYRDVEATSVTPFAPRAVDKALRAVFVAMVRHLVPSMRATPILTAAKRSEAEKLRKVIVARATGIDPVEAASVKAKLDVILDEWESRGKLKDYWNEYRPEQTLLMSAERIASIRAANRTPGAAWPAPNSMREVEPGTHFRLLN